MNHNEIGRDVVDRPTSLSLFLLLVLVAIPGASAGLYVVDVDLPPQNPVHNVVVTYSLPVGVIYKTGSFSASGASISSHQEVVSTPNDGSAPVTVTWTIESVYNTGNQDLEIQFDGIVANVTGNQDGVQLPPGTVSYTYDGGLGAKTGRSQPTEIVEPDLTILKRRSRETQGQVTFELMVYHTPKSHSDAHDVVITDVLPNNMRYVPNSIEIIAGPSGTTIVSGADLTWNFPLIGRSWESGNEVKLEYKANKGQTSSSTTPRTLVWTSAEGAGYGEDRFYTLRFNETVMIVSISCSAESVTVGKEITYTYTITNIGAARVDNVQLTNKSGSIIPLTPTPTSLETGESATGLENYIVQESDLPGPLVNTATVTGTDRYGRSVSAVGTISVPFGIVPTECQKDGPQQDRRAGRQRNLHHRDREQRNLWLRPAHQHHRRGRLQHARGDLIGIAATGHGRPMAIPQNRSRLFGEDNPGGEGSREAGLQLHLSERRFRLGFRQRRQLLHHLPRSLPPQKLRLRHLLQLDFPRRDRDYREE